jgi:hypothetical protein
MNTNEHESLQALKSLRWEHGLQAASASKHEGKLNDDGS